MQDIISAAEDFIEKYGDRPFNWPLTIFALAIIAAIFIGMEIHRVRTKSVVINFPHMVVGVGLGFGIFLAANMFFGDVLLIMSIVVALLITIFVRNKYFAFLLDDTEKKQSMKKVSFSDMQKKLQMRSLTTISIIEVLLFYDYISVSQKETVELNGLFMSPDEIAKQFLKIPILTEDQLKEATAILNVIRREGRLVSKEEALMIISQLTSAPVQKPPVIPVQTTGTEGGTEDAADNKDGRNLTVQR